MEVPMSMEKTRAHLVFIPLPAVGHLIATVELAKLILSHPTTHQHFTITNIILTPSVPNPQLNSYISTTTVPNLTFLELQPIPISPPLPVNIRPEALASIYLDIYKPSVKAALQSLLTTSPITVLVLDFFCSNMIDLGHELGIPPYIFFTSSATMLGLLLHYPTAIDPFIPVDKTAMEMAGETLPFPGLSTQLPFIALPDTFVRGRDDAYKAFMDHAVRLRGAAGFLVNTFEELQPGPIKALEDGLYYAGDQPTPQVYSIGPVLSLKAEPKQACITWLDSQPRGSVVFLCFGSKGSFAEAQVREIAVGLERSGHRFLWVLRAPPEKGSGILRDAVLDDLLPEGFVERTKERGLVWPSFAPQGEVLGHVSVGGFVTHCGWNSCLESLWFGVPMVAWPLYAEQHLNAYEMVVEMGVAVEMKFERERDNWVDSEEVERAVRLLMGDGSFKVRERVMELKEKGRKAVEVGGSSYCSWLKVVETWMNGSSVGPRKMTNC